MHKDRSALAHIWRSNLLEMRVNALAAERLVVRRDHALRVAFADRGRIRIHGVEQNLYGDGPAALQIARVVVGNHEPSIEFSARDQLAHFIYGEIIAGGLEALALGHVGDEL